MLLKSLNHLVMNKIKFFIKKRRLLRFQLTQRLTFIYMAFQSV